LYGTTLEGGNGTGVVFRMNKQTGVISLSLPMASGASPIRGLVRDAAGNLYVAGALGGRGCGTVFKVGVKGIFKGLYYFRCQPDGAQPQSGLVRVASGDLYGTTALGGTNNFGTVFKLDATGIETVLHSFSGGADGQFPHAGLTIDSAGNLYGVTAGDGVTSFGTVFKLDTAGVETVLYEFSGGADGSQPMANLSQDKAGNLYGTTRAGGALGSGTVFKVDRQGNESVLHSFAGSSDGASLESAILVDPAGNLYGTTVLGGTSNSGTAFKIDVNGNETVLHTFLGGTDGTYPYAGLVRDSSGNLYGATTEGGAGYGTIFRIVP